MSDGFWLKERQPFNLNLKFRMGRLRVNSEVVSQSSLADRMVDKHPDRILTSLHSNLPVDCTIPNMSKSPSTITEINGLRFLMQNITPEANRWVSQIKSYDKRRYRVLLPSNQSRTSSTTHMSLETILEETTLLRDDCLHISSMLAESLLEFSSYPGSFFQIGWRSRDIFFFQESQNPGTLYIVPIFAKTLNCQEATAMPKGYSETPPSPARSEQLFSLALTLIELGYGCPLWKIPGRYKIPQTANPIEQFMKAKDVINSKSLSREAGAAFSQVVARCLYCDFGIDEDDLSKKELQEIFYKKVAVPLKGCLIRHLGGG